MTRTNLIYRIKVSGELDQSWADWLGRVQIIPERAEDGSVVTTLSGEAVDQPALFGILDRIREFNLIMMKVERREIRTDKGN